MLTNNALVTYTDLTTMLVPITGLTPPTGNQIATKSFIDTYYRVDTASSPYSTYSANRCPPYQTIQPQVLPYLACWNITILPYSELNCQGNYNSFETWQISLLDQYGNAYFTDQNYSFNIGYDYTWQSDIPPYSESGSNVTTVNISPGQWQGFASFTIYAVETCPYSSACDGSCFSTNTNITELTNTTGVPGGCALPTPATITYFVPNAFIPESSNPAVNVVRIYKVINSTAIELVYSNYPNMTWVFATGGFVPYSGNNSVYVPWNGRLNNSGMLSSSTAYGYSFALNDGSGTIITGTILLLR